MYLIQRNQQVYFSEAHEMLMETACSHSACAFLELKKNSQKEKNTLSSLPRALQRQRVRFFSLSLKIQHFCSFPLLQPAFIPRFCVLHHGSDALFQQTSLHAPIPKYRGTSLCTTLAMSK